MRAGNSLAISPTSHPPLRVQSIRIRHMGNNQSNSWRVENNINNGAGTYNNVKGNQTINMGGVKFELHTNVGTQRSPPEHDRVPELPAPYDLAAYQLVEADRLLQEIETGIPMSRKISELRSDIEDFLQVVICVGSAMDFISRTTPQLSSNSFVERITQCAFEWSRHLKQLPADIRGYQTHIGCYIDADSCLRRIFLSIFEDYRWRPWLRNMRAFIRRSSFSSKVSLAVLSTPACNKIFGEALRSLIKESNLLSTPEMENFTVNTFWVQRPAGSVWYAIPIDFCTSRMDLQHILSHLCQNGPEEDYIYLGNWEIVRIADDTVIDKDLFAKTVKAAMRFDIRIIGQSRRTSSHTCPNVAAIAARRVLLAALAGYLASHAGTSFASSQPLRPSEATAAAQLYHTRRIAQQAPAGLILHNYPTIVRPHAGVRNIHVHVPLSSQKIGLLAFVASPSCRAPPIRAPFRRPLPTTPTTMRSPARRRLLSAIFTILITMRRGRLLSTVPITAKNTVLGTKIPSSSICAIPRCHCRREPCPGWEEKVAKLLSV
ncbi:hypothetical protein AB1N83_012208 [Pleurotus pulmonarius]